MSPSPKCTVPVQFAAKAYFNALLRVDLDEIAARWTGHEREEFLCAHLMASTREVRPDVVRLLFQLVDSRVQLHRILLFCDKGHEDETFTKTALEWAVENNDR